MYQRGPGRSRTQAVFRESLGQWIVFVLVLRATNVGIRSASIGPGAACRLLG